MNYAEFAEEVGKLMDQVLPQAGRLVLDIGRVNHICLQVTAKSREWNPDSHWDDHDRYTPEEWRFEVVELGTRESYIEWVNSRIDEG